MIAAAVATVTVESLRLQPSSHRSDLALSALTQAATSRPELSVRSSDRYQGGADWLLLWGPGNPTRFDIMARQIAAGGHVIALDLAYWDRDRKIRVSIDAPHPQAWVMRRDWPATRFTADRVPVADLWKPDGPVVIAGLGDKARVQYGADVVDRWEAAMARACAARWPSRKVLYRTKRGNVQPIETVLRGASLVITWHSNVAVDAIRLGIPVICRDGAAAAVCPSTWPDDGMPQPLDLHTRMQFLHNLAWFQWDPKTEAQECWAFLRELLA